jgi:hypothetical protein
VDVTEEWRRNGLRLQLVSRWILPRLGFQIVKAQEQPLGPVLQSKLQRISVYLRDYSDYIASRQSRLHVIEVKAPATFRSAGRPFYFKFVKFTNSQVREFDKSPVPVKVLLWDYGMAHSLFSLRTRVFYTLVDFRDFEIAEKLPDAVKMRLRRCPVTKPRWISSKTLKYMLQRSNAEKVREIGPGCVLRDP